MDLKNPFQKEFCSIFVGALVDWFVDFAFDVGMKLSCLFKALIRNLDTETTELSDSHFFRSVDETIVTGTGKSRRWVQSENKMKIRDEDCDFRPTVLHILSRRDCQLFKIKYLRGKEKK